MTRVAQHIKTVRDREALRPLPPGITRTYSQYEITVREVPEIPGYECGWHWIWRCELGACVVEGVARGDVDMAFDTAQREVKRFTR